MLTRKKNLTDPFRHQNINKSHFIHLNGHASPGANYYQHSGQEIRFAKQELWPFSLREWGRQTTLPLDSIKCFEFLAHLISAIFSDRFSKHVFLLVFFFSLYTFCKITFMCYGNHHPSVLFALKLLLEIWSWRQNLESHWPDCFLRCHLGYRKEGTENKGKTKIDILTTKSILQEQNGDDSHLKKILFTKTLVFSCI